MDGWGEGSLASRCRTCQTNPGLSSTADPSSTGSFVQPTAVTVHVYRAFPILPCKYVDHIDHTIFFLSYHIHKIYLSYPSFRPPAPRSPDAANQRPAWPACMRAYAWHTTACPELSIETMRLPTIISLLSQSRQADPSSPSALHTRLPRYSRSPWLAGTLVWRVRSDIGVPP